MGRAYHLPGDLAGRWNLLLLGFRRSHQDAIDTWMPLALDLGARRDDLHTYEVPVLGAGWKLLRGWVEGGMRGGIPDVSARERTITVYTDKRRFLEAMDLPDDERILAVLCDRQGEVLWSALGRHDADAEAELRQLLGKLDADTG